MKAFNKFEPTGFSKVNENDCLKYVLIGISPGTMQTKEELKTKAEKEGIEFDTLDYKFRFAFSGDKMRNNLYKMFKAKKELKELVSFIDKKGDIDSLFNYTNESLIDFTSLIKNKATYQNAKNQTILFKTPKDINKDRYENLWKEYVDGFKKDYDNIYSKKELIYIACGKAVYNFLITVVNIPKERVIAIVHPSPAAQGYINSFLKGEYNPEKLY